MGVLGVRQAVESGRGGRPAADECGVRGGE